MNKRAVLTLCLAAALIPLPASAAVPTVINVEVDWMYAADHRHFLFQDEVDALVQMFACQGITLNIEVSDSIPEVVVLAPAPGGTIFENDGIEPDGFLTLKNNYFNHAGDPGWHYCIMAHQYSLGGAATTSSGYAEILGDDFIVTLGAWFEQVGFPIDRAGTVAHELGHNLGLYHTGDQSSSVLQYKPNYASVMTYRYQVWGVRAFMECNGMLDDCHVVPLRSLDYSHGNLLTIDENALDESAGVGLGPVDWNCNSSIDAAPVARDLSSTWDWCAVGGSLTSIADFDDWANIQDVTFTASAKMLQHREVIGCATFEEVQALRSAKMGTCVWYPIPVTAEPCIEPPTDDADFDGLRDFCDNCLSTVNPDQADSDGDAIGDACDNCISLPNAAQEDLDADGVGDICDNCPTTYNPGQEDTNDNGIGDVCDCSCPFQADIDAGGAVDAVDLAIEIDVIFFGQSEVQDPGCPRTRNDFNADTVSDAVDLALLIDHVFFGGTGPADPCNS